MICAHRLSAVVASVVGLLLLAYVFWERKNPNITETAAPAATLAFPQPDRALSGWQRDFPVDDLRSALAHVCSNDVADAAAQEWTEDGVHAQLTAFKELRLGLSQRLSVSSSAEHLHLAAMLEDDPAIRVELLDRAISGNPSDPYLLWGAVQICSESVEFTHCPLREWEKLLIAVDSQNSESWIRVAANRYASGEHGVALEALRHASTAAESRAYWTETIEMIERGLAAGSDYAFPERAGMALGYAASALPRYNDYVTMCKEQSERSVNWAYACLAYGELVERQGKTEMGVSIARSIQILALEDLGEVDKAAEVRSRIEAHHRERLDSFKDHNATIERLIFSNPTLFSAYLAAIRSVGEHAARRQIVIEIERLLERQPELICRPISSNLPLRR